MLVQMCAKYQVANHIPELGENNVPSSHFWPQKQDMAIFPVQT